MELDRFVQAGLSNPDFGFEHLSFCDKTPQQVLWSTLSLSPSNRIGHS